MGRPRGRPRAAWREYAHGSEAAHFAKFCGDHLIQSVDRWDGLPLELERWQLEMMGEALAFDERGMPVWSAVVIVLPRKNGKTQLLAAYAVYRLLTSGGSPEILLAAASDKQADRLFQAAATMIRRSPVLSGLVRVRDHVGEIRREDGMGAVYRMASDPSRLHGFNPSEVIVDELHAWSTPSLRRAFGALTSAGGARSSPRLFVISTAGEAQDRKESILGRILDEAVARGEVAARPGLQVARHWDARMLVFNHEAPTSDPMDAAALKLANPASWITEEFLLRQAVSPELTAPEVLQLHGCVWAEGVLAWLPAERWHACRDGGVVSDGAAVTVGVDVALRHDTTAVAVAAADGGRTRVQATVWAADERAAAHAFMPGRIDLGVIEEHIRHLCRRFRVLEVAYDPRFFERSAQQLAEEGVPMVEMVQSSSSMADAYGAWYAAVLEGRVRHAGDPVLDAHVLGAAAQQTERGWKVSKIRQSQHIDACVAAAMALWRCEQQARQQPWVGSW